MTDKEYAKVISVIDFLQKLENLRDTISEEDCINREDAINAAIDAVDEWDGGCNTSRATMISNAIKDLPSVTPSYNSIKTELDCVSREEAINELKLAYFNKDLQSAKDDPCIVDAMTDWAIRTIKNLPSVTPQKSWIPCSERLPKLYEEVIVTDIETSDTYVSWYIGNGYWECDNGSFKNRIIAWQPKPQPYKVESEGE